jgi:hypothetical protein
MIENSTNFRSGLTMFLFAALLGFGLLGFSGDASAESWKGFKSQHDYNEAVHHMNSGYSELGKVATKLQQDKVSSARRHFNSAIKHFDKAITYYAKAELPASDKPAIDALKKGLDALRKSDKALEKNDLSKAQKNYDTAQDYFAEAAALLE